VKTSEVVVPETTVSGVTVIVPSPLLADSLTTTTGLPEMVAAEPPELVVVVKNVALPTDKVAVTRFPDNP
jgi:hypothetical protein